MISGNVCRLFGAKPLFEPIMTNSHLDYMDFFNKILIEKWNVFTQENVSEYVVWKMVPVSARPKCVI